MRKPTKEKKRKKKEIKSIQTSKICFETRNIHTHETYTCMYSKHNRVKNTVGKPMFETNLFLWQSLEAIALKSQQSWIRESCPLYHCVKEWTLILLWITILFCYLLPFCISAFKTIDLFRNSNSTFTRVRVSMTL